MIDKETYISYTCLIISRNLSDTLDDKHKSFAIYVPPKYIFADREFRNDVTIFLCSDHDVHSNQV